MKPSKTKRHRPRNNAMRELEPFDSFHRMEVQEKICDFLADKCDPAHKLNLLYWVVSSINLGRWRDPRKTKASYVNLHSGILNYLLGDGNYKWALETLIDLKVIESDGIWWRQKKGAGGKATGFRISEGFVSGPYRKIPIDGPYRFPDRVDSHLKGGRYGFPSPAHRHIHEINQQLTIRSHLGALVALRELLGGKAKEKFEAAYSHQWALLNRLDEAEHPVIDAYGRIYSPITNIKRELRSGLRLWGRPLWGVDVSCSHLAHVVFLHPRPDCPEAKTLREIIMDGDIYTMLRDNPSTPYASRDDAKTPLLKVIHSYPDWIAEDAIPAREVFKEEFPILWKWMCSKKPKWSPKKLSHEILRRESQVVITDSVGRLMEVDPDFGVTSVHDALFCHQENTEAVREAMVKSHLAMYGYAPRIKIGEAPDLDSDLFEEVRADEDQQTPL